MARTRHTRWQNFGKEAKRGYTPKPAGITNAQARFLASLQREKGLPYTGAGLTCQEASTWIRILLKERER